MERLCIPMLANMEEEQDTAAFRWGLMISDSLKMVLQCSPSRRLPPSSAGSLPLGNDPDTASFRWGMMISDSLRMALQ